MALSPIKMFESSQSSLAQILAGGNQSVMSIMDKAIQIGRDMSNKQLSQEKDLLAMRQQETNMFQRRAENLQQNNEDAINFSRRAFESDRKFGLDVAQETRAGVKDVFAMGDASARTALAERGVKVQEGSLDLRNKELQAEQEKAAQITQQNLNIAAGTEGSVSSERAPNSLSAAVDVAGMFNTEAKPSGSISGYVPPKSLAEAQARFKAAEKAGNTSLMSQLGQSVAEFSKKEDSTVKASDPLITEKRQLDIDKSRMATFKEKATSLVTDSEAFLPTATWMAQKFGTDPTTRNIKAAGADGKGGASPAQLAEGLAYKADPVGSEMRFADQYATADEYAEAMPNASPKAKNLRRKFWNEYMAAQGGGGAAPAASPVDSIPGI